MQLDENITHQDTTTLNDLINNIKPKWFGTAAERADPTQPYSLQNEWHFTMQYLLTISQGSFLDHLV